MAAATYIVRRGADIMAVRRFRALLAAMGVTLLVALGANAQEPSSAPDTVIYKLKHRTAEELLPSLQGQLARYQATVSGIGQRIIITAPHQEIPRLTAILEELDTRPHRLVITVARSPELGGLPGAIGKGGPAAGTGGAPETSFTAYHTRGGRDLLVSPETSGYGMHTRPRIDPQDIQRVSVLEGHWASVTVADAPTSPGLTAEVTVRPGLTVFSDQPAGTGSATGILVRATLIGDRFVLDIAYTGASPSPRQGGQIETETLRTTLRGRLGEWLPLDAAPASNPPDGQPGLHLATSERRQAPGALFVRVDEAAD
jgi:hypothetical protein